MSSASSPSLLYTVDYGREPFCYVRASTTTEAISIAESLLALRLRGETRHARLGAAPLVKPPAIEAAKLRARRPTASEQYQFTSTSQRNGVPSPYLAGVMA